MSPYYHGYIYSPEWKSTLFSGSTELNELPEGKYYFSGGYLPEGSQIYVQLLTQGIAPGTWLYWRGEGAGIDDDDFTNNTNWGAATVKPRTSSDGWDGEITFTHTFKNDSKKEENLEHLRYSEAKEEDPAKPAHSYARWPWLSTLICTSIHKFKKKMKICFN